MKKLSRKIAILENRSPSQELEKTEKEYNLTISQLSKLQN